MKKLKLSIGGILKFLTPSFIFVEESKHPEMILLFTSSKHFSLK